MSLTNCLRKAGDALNPSDKAATGWMSACSAPRPSTCATARP